MLMIMSFRYCAKDTVLSVMNQSTYTHNIQAIILQRLYMQTATMSTSIDKNVFYILGGTSNNNFNNFFYMYGVRARS